jgi:acetyl esterase/lipase
MKIFEAQSEWPFEIRVAARNPSRSLGHLEILSQRWVKGCLVPSALSVVVIALFSCGEVSGSPLKFQMAGKAEANLLPEKSVAVPSSTISSSTASIQGEPKLRERINSSARSLDFEKHGAITYREIGEQALNCDVYVPEGDGPYPAVIAIHGGAWRQGSKFAMLRHAWRLAKSGYVVVAINYRHAPEHQFPAQIHDCKYAVRWMRANANEYKIDPMRIAAFGYSAGGHLAALLGTTNQADGLEGIDGLPATKSLSQFSSAVQATVIGGAPCEFDWIGENSSTLVYWLGQKRANAPDVYLKASPTHYVTADDTPFYIFHGEQDMIVPLRSSEKMHQRLLESGVESKREVAVNLGHIATFSDLSWMTRAIGFLDKHLKNEKPEKPSPSNDPGE